MCGEDREIDVTSWDLPAPCKACKRSSVLEDQLQVNISTQSPDYHPQLSARELPEALLPADAEGRDGDVREEF